MAKKLAQVPVSEAVHAFLVAAGGGDRGAVPFALRIALCHWLADPRTPIPSADPNPILQARARRELLEALRD